jgi:hypothetical protein
VLSFPGVKIANGVEFECGEKIVVSSFPGVEFSWNRFKDALSTLVALDMFIV